MEVFKKQRTQLKRTITKIYRFVHNQQAMYNDIKVRIVELDNAYTKYKEVQNEIDILCETEEEVQKENEYRDEIEEIYFAAKSFWAGQTQDNLENTIVEGATASSPNVINDLSTSIQAIVQQQSTATSVLEAMSATLTTVTNLHASTMQSSCNNRSELRLPSIQIPDFDGDLSNWIRFRDLFNATVDSRTNLSNVEKLEYLQTKLTGEASTIIKHLTPTNDNYQVAWDLIKENYDRPDMIERKYFELLFDPKSVRNGTLIEFKRFYNNTIECYNALKVLNDAIDSWDRVLLFLIEKKIDQDTITLWHRQKKDDELQTFPQLLKFLGKRVIELEEQQKSNQSSRYPKQGKVLTMTSTAQSCPLCDKDHFLYSCQQFRALNIDKRGDIVRKSKLCFNCLREKHFSKDCKSSSCKSCNLKHNTLLHTGSIAPYSDANRQNHDRSEVSGSISINSSQQVTHQTTLLPTAIIMVRNRNGSLQPCRALIDSGAQSTLISEACAQRLRLDRTSYIISHLPASQWHHIASKQNPADLATRGISSEDIISNSLWWHGPQILQNQILQPHSTITISNDVLLEKKKTLIATAIPVSENEIDLFDRYSSFTKLLRITALLLRFTDNCRSKGDNSEKKIGFISTTELSRAHTALVKRSQQMSFGTERRILASNKPLPTTLKLTGLSPFMDCQFILRVGGRLENAHINYDQKHPYILHKDNHLTQLIVRYYHIKYLHAGTRQLQYLLSVKYWIPDVTYLIKRTVYKCTTCMRFRQIPYQQRMGDLPSYRLQPSSTFLHVGIDFAGPLLVRSWKGRGSRNYKCWIAIFVCLSTKAIHLEAVTELSTAAFLASLRRFTSRRGKPSHIYTDNGTNFVGCNQELKELFDFLHTSHELINQELSFQRIKWHFIPPSAPNFGGIWEAGVKSVKFHLNRVLKTSTATYEELNTLLCQIECCLNSRPLCLKFEGDMDPLTPGHFLILRPMTSIPDENLIDVNVNRLTRWQYIQQLVQQFWSKWSTEYLSQLQKKPKWLQKLQNLQLNDIVLIKDNNQPPTQWLMGRITATHPGNDGLVRVATVKTKNGLLKRPVSKLCPLFLDG